MGNYIFAYYQAILDGTEVVGRWIRLLYKIIVEGIEAGRWHFDEGKANNAIRFIEKYVRHNKGPMAPRLLQLELWEKALISVIFGIVDDRGFRQFREVAVIIGRKCGKTLLAGGIAAYMTYAAGDFGSEIYFVAPKLDQTDLVYNAFTFTVDNTPAMAMITKSRKSDLYIKSTNTTIKRLAFNAKKSDGFNPMLVVADEVAAWPAAMGKRQYEVLTSGDIARLEPMMLAITSGGYVNDGPYDELVGRGTKWLLGSSSEMHLLPVFYMIDDPHKWDDINELRKSLPQLGKSIKVETICSKIATAKASLSAKAEFLAKYCNIKQSISQAWLPALDIEKASGPEIRPEDFARCYCVGGIDLSRTTDLTAACIIIEKNGELYIMARFFMPSAKLEEAIARDGLPYDIYVQRGLLQLSGENFVNYRDVEAWFREFIERWKIYPLKVGFDRYSALELVDSMKNYGFHMDDVFQGFNLTPVINTFDGLLRDGKVHIGDNDLLKIHLLNSALKQDAQTERVRLVKLKATDHVDGMAAVLDAMTMRSKWWAEVGHQLRNERRT